MLEIEMKFPATSFAPVIAKLEAWAARRDEPLDEADHYFNAPDRDFAKTDEAFRLRRIGPKNVATYKGAKEPGPTKTRKEIEVHLTEGAKEAEKFCELAKCLGFRPVAEVRKHRVIYHFKREGFALQVCLDDVERLGPFVEVEIVAPAEDKDRAQAVLQQTVAALGLANSESRSYLEMVLGQS